jgi:hypothetical protein
VCVCVCVCVSVCVCVCACECVCVCVCVCGCECAHLRVPEPLDGAGCISTRNLLCGLLNRNRRLDLDVANAILAIRPLFHPTSTRQLVEEVPV